MYCPNCGSFMQDTLKFCTQCGTALHPELYQKNAQQQNPGQFSQMPRNDSGVSPGSAVQAKGKTPNMKIIAVILIAVVAVAIAALVIINPFDSGVKYPYEYELGYDGYYLDLGSYDDIVSGMSLSNYHGIICGLDENGFTELHIYREKYGSTYSGVVGDGMVLTDLYKTDQYYLVSFLGPMSADVPIIDAYFKEYAKKHPSSGTVMVPVYWAYKQYYLVDRATCKMFFLPFSGCWEYNYDTGEYMSEDPRGYPIALTDDSVYFRINYYSQQYNGIYRIHIDNGQLVSNKVLENSIAEDVQVTRNNVLILDQKYALTLNGDRILIPENSFFIDGLLCKDVTIDGGLGVSNYFNRLKITTRISQHPASAYYMDSDGHYQFVKYSLEDVDRFISDSIYYSFDKDIGWKGYYNGYLNSDDNYLYGSGIDGFIRYDIETLVPEIEYNYVYPVETIIETSLNDCHIYNNIAVCIDVDTLFVYDALQKKVIYTGFDLFNLSSCDFTNGFVHIEYSDSSFQTHRLYIGMDGSITDSPQENIVWSFYYIM